MIPDLTPGDHLIYGIRGHLGARLMNVAIALKTGCTDAVHVEVYDGDGASLASRAGHGVDRYPTDYDGLTYVLRPRDPWLMWPARDWFCDEAQGQGYDWLAIARFVIPWLRDLDRTRQVCSAFATRLGRSGGLLVFAPWVDADTVAPRDFIYSPAFDVVWAKGEMITCDD